MPKDPLPFCVCDKSWPDEELCGKCHKCNLPLPPQGEKVCCMYCASGNADGEPFKKINYCLDSGCDCHGGHKESSVKVGPLGIGEVPQEEWDLRLKENNLLRPKETPAEGMAGFQKKLDAVVRDLDVKDWVARTTALVEEYLAEERQRGREEVVAILQKQVNECDVGDECHQCPIRREILLAAKSPREGAEGK